MSNLNTPKPWRYRKMRTHFVIEAANGVRVAELRFIGRPDGSTSEEEAAHIVNLANRPVEPFESQFLAAIDNRLKQLEQAITILTTIGDAMGASFFEHDARRDELQTLRDYLTGEKT